MERYRAESSDDGVKIRDGRDHVRAAVVEMPRGLEVFVFDDGLFPAAAVVFNDDDGRVILTLCGPDGHVLFAATIMEGKKLFSAADSSGTLESVDLVGKAVAIAKAAAIVAAPSLN